MRGFSIAGPRSIGPFCRSNKARNHALGHIRAPATAVNAMEILTTEWGDSNEWAPVHLRHRGALHLRFSEEWLVKTSMI
jgi:hypothetical protein